MGTKISNTDILNAAWQSPSNIALVKYWGKKGLQIPANPSISFTLDNAVTKTNVKAERRNKQNGVSFEFFFENETNETFTNKIKDYLNKAVARFKWLEEYHLTIHSGNSFPHSSGIASSASAFSALALCICSLDEQITQKKLPDFFQTASNWARIGSGSACRSVYGGYNLWGQTEFIAESADEFAVNIDHLIHPGFKDLKDTVLIIEKGKKAVSSSTGHSLLKEHPFAEARYRVAHENTGKLLHILKDGDMASFISLVESEALMLHSLMMASSTPYILMKPNTLAVLEKIMDFRQQTGLSLLFTLDAGANVHLLHTANQSEQIQQFVQNELVGFCQNGLYLCNAIGNGPLEQKQC